MKSSFLIGGLVVVSDQKGNLQLIHDLGWSGGMNPSRYQMGRQLQTPHRRANKAQSSATTHPFPLDICSKHRKTACVSFSLLHTVDTTSCTDRVTGGWLTTYLLYIFGAQSSWIFCFASLGSKNNQFWAILFVRRNQLHHT